MGYELFQNIFNQGYGNSYNYGNFAPYPTSEKEYYVNEGVSLFKEILSNIGSSSSSVPAAEDPSVAQQITETKTAIAEKDSKISDYLSKLPAGANTEETYQNAKVEDTTEYTTWSTLSASVDANQKIVDNYELSSNEAIITKYNELKTASLGTGDAAEQAKTQLTSMQAEYDEAVKAKREYLQAKRQLEADKAALSTAASAKDAKAKEIETAKTELKKLIDAKKELNEKLAELYDSNLNAALNAGDGNGVSRIFSPKKRQVNDFSSTKNELVKAIKAGDVSAAKAAAEKLTAEGALPQSSSKTDTKAAIKLGNAYLSTNAAALDLIKDGKLENLTNEQKMQLGIF